MSIAVIFAIALWFALQFPLGIAAGKWIKAGGLA